MYKFFCLIFFLKKPRLTHTCHAKQWPTPPSGAIDGTHIDAFVPDDAVACYRNRKGSLSQNVLAACTFNLWFSYVLPGWEGSAADGCVFDNAQLESLAISPGTYFLADAGFPTCDALMIPYKGERYHLKEWENAPQKYLFIYL